MSCLCSHRLMVSLLWRGVWSLIGINPLARRRRPRPDIGDDATAQQVRLAVGRVYRRCGPPLGAEIAQDQPVPPVALRRIQDCSVQALSNWAAFRERWRGAAGRGLIRAPGAAGGKASRPSGESGSMRPHDGPFHGLRSPADDVCGNACFGRGFNALPRSGPPGRKILLSLFQNS